MTMSNIPFEQVLLKVSPALEYENLLKIMEICSRNKLTSGDKQTQITVVELPQ